MRTHPEARGEAKPFVLTEATSRVRAIFENHEDKGESVVSYAIVSRNGDGDSTPYFNHFRLPSS